MVSRMAYTVSRSISGSKTPEWTGGISQCTVPRAVKLAVVQIASFWPLNFPLFSGAAKGASCHKQPAAGGAGRVPAASSGWRTWALSMLRGHAQHACVNATWVCGLLQGR